MTTASSLVDPDTLPSNALDVWEPVCLPAPNWVNPVVVTTEYQTEVAQADTGAETRRSLASAPTRTISYRLTGAPGKDLRLSQMFLERLTMAHGLVPLWPDMIQITAELTASGTSISCDPSLRRFVAGARVAIFAKPSSFTIIDTFELDTIDSVGGSTITIDNGFAATYPAGSYLVPMVEVLPAFDGSFEWITTKIQQGTISAAEAFGEGCLDALAAEDTYPGGLDTYQSLPIWPWYDNSDAQVEVELSSRGEVIDIGGRPFVSKTNSLPTQAYSYGLNFERSEWLTFVQFFDAARGRNGSFWHLSPGSDLEITALTTTEIRVEATGPLADWLLRKYVGLDMIDGTQHVAEIDNVTSSGSEHIIALADALPALSLSNVLRCCLARRVRFEEDTISETWFTTDVCQVRAVLTELHEEKSVDINYTSLYVGPAATVKADGCAESGAPSPPQSNLYMHWDASNDDGWTTYNDGTYDYMVAVNLATAPFDPDLIGYQIYPGELSAARDVLDVRDQSTFSGKKVLHFESGVTFTGNEWGDKVPGQPTISWPGNDVTVYSVIEMEVPGGSYPAGAGSFLRTDGTEPRVGIVGVSPNMHWTISPSAGVDGRSSSPVITSYPGTTGAVLAKAIFESSRTRLYIDGTLMVDDTTGYSMSNPAIGCGTSLYITKVAEMAWYDTVIESGSEADSETESYLTSKWDI